MSQNQKNGRLRFFYQYRHELMVLIIFVAVVVYWFQTVDSFEGHLTFFFIYYYITFSKNILATYLALLLCYVILGRRQWKNRFKNALLNVVTLSIIILLVELPALLGWVDYTVLLVPKMLGGPGPHTRQLEPTGYFHRPAYDQFSNALPGDAAILLGVNSNRRYYAEHFYDKNGFRNNQDLEKAAVVLLGDSFIEGYKVTQEEIVSNQLSQLIDVEVSNLGQSDYGPKHELAVLRQIGLDLEPSVVVWFFFEGNDLYDLDNRSKIIADMFSFKERSFFLNILKIAASWTNQFVLSYMDLALEHSAQLLVPRSTMYLRIAPYTITETKLTQFEQFQEVIREAKTICDQNDIKFLLVYVPIKLRVYQELLVFPEESVVGHWALLNDLPERFAQWAEATDIHYLDLTPFLQQAASERQLVYFLDDEHWTSAGHERVAQQLAVFLHEKGLLEESTHEIGQLNHINK